MDVIKKFQDYLTQPILAVELLHYFNYKSPELTDTKPNTVNLGEKISETPSGHHVFKAPRDDAQHPVYRAYNPATGLVDMQVRGKLKKHPDGSHRLSNLSLSGREGSSLKAHQFYHHLITNHNVTLDANQQSVGGMKVWRKLAEDPDVHVYGRSPRTGKIHNIATIEDIPSKTHRIKTAKENKANKAIRAMHLIAHKRQPEI